MSNARLKRNFAIGFMIGVHCTGESQVRNLDKYAGEMRIVPRKAQR